MVPRKTLWFTFGNHMHWVDMQWLWGYGVLPDCIGDMLRLCEDVGARGNVNFDGVGYEKLAAESPEALAELRAAVGEGRVEVVGGSYGQPYGLFHGGESNVRQRVFGARAVRRLLGVWPRAFWEEEFDFFPQLPQILRGTGFEAACLFFQWTWHTPVVPEEREALVQWEGVDGTRLPALAKTDLCLHQWPEDFDGRLDTAMAREEERAVLVQWLELLPSPDWMCRSELLLPRLRELFRDPRFDVRPGTLSELVAELDDGSAPVRRYGMDDVFHGVSLGKNGDGLRRCSRAAEASLLAAESAAVLAGLFGRPYPSWGVYPVWELDEAWRELLAAQHHDNEECEGLCGFVGRASYERSLSLSGGVLQRTLDHLAARAGSDVVFNPSGWTREDRGALVPAFGYAVAQDAPAPQVTSSTSAGAIELVAEGLRAVIDSRSGKVLQVFDASFPEGVLAEPLLDFALTRAGADEGFPECEVAVERAGSPAVRVRRSGPAGRIDCAVGIRRDPLAVEVHVVAQGIARPDSGAAAGLRLPLAPAFAADRLLADTPYAVEEIRAERDRVRKVPTGDWMTSPQVFETVHRPFSALSFVDLDAGDRGLLWAHDGSQAFSRTETGFTNLLAAYDPWDESYWPGALDARLWLVPHAALRRSELWRIAQECRTPFLRGTRGGTRYAGGGALSAEPDLPPSFGALHVEPANVVATALYRESRWAQQHAPEAFAAGVELPVVARLVELDGVESEAFLAVPGPVARAARTNLLGEVLEELTVQPQAAPRGCGTSNWCAVRVAVRAHAIETIQLDLERARHAPRHLDGHRGVWAKVHRVEVREGERE